MDPQFSGRARSGRLLFEVPLALALALIGVYFVLRHQAGDGGVALLTDHEVLVRVDNRSGELSPDDRPGAHTFVPWLEEVHRLDRRALRYVMGAADGPVDLGAPALIVRGREGSNFAFGRVEVQAVLDPNGADLALVDHGGDREAMLRLVDAYARPALRHAFGRFAPREIVLPENKQAATGEALTMLSGTLARHGIKVLELSVSKPKFAEKYQETINRRKVAEQDTERLKGERDELEAAVDERARVVTEQEERKLELLIRDLAEKERLAARSAAGLRRAADRKVEDATIAATLSRDGDLARAAVIEARNRAEAAAFRTRLAAMESQGELAVRAALVERLQSITFDLVPYERPDESKARRATLGGTE